MNVRSKCKAAFKLFAHFGSDSKGRDMWASADLLPASDYVNFSGWVSEPLSCCRFSSAKLIGLCAYASIVGAIAGRLFGNCRP